MASLICASVTRAMWLHVWSRLTQSGGRVQKRRSGNPWKSAMSRSA